MVPHPPLLVQGKDLTPTLASHRFPSSLSSPEVSHRQQSQLWAMAPHDEHVLHLDIPVQEVDGVC